MSQDIESRVAALELKIQDLEDRETVRNLRFRYHECINSQELAQIPDLFTDDAVLDFDYLGNARGRAELQKFFAKVERNSKIFTKILFINYIYVCFGLLVGWNDIF